MIKKFKIYLERKTINDIVDSISRDFWKMVDIANWQDFINIMKTEKYDYSCEIEKVQGRVFKNFEYSEIVKFNQEYKKLYYHLFDTFNQTLPVDENGKKIYISDDSYIDLISSIIAFGEEYIKNSINNKDIIKDMILKENYYENFEYIIHISKEKYHHIRCKYDHIYCDTSKYNL